MTRTRTRILAAFLLTLAPALGLAQPSAQRVFVPIASEWDADSSTYTFISLLNQRGDAVSSGIPVNDRVTTSGSSTTVTAVGSTAPFGGVSAGDEILINLDGLATWRYVATKTSATEITVNAAVNLSSGLQGTAGYPFHFWKRTTGTAATAGWIPVRNFSSVNFMIDIAQMNATSIDVKIECRLFGSVGNPVVIWSNNYTVAGADFVSSSARYHQCRVGVDVNTDDGSDTGADAEKITITMEGSN